MAVFTDLNDALERVDDLLEAPASNRLTDVASSAKQFSLFGGSHGVSQEVWNLHYPNPATRPPMLARSESYTAQVNLTAFQAGFINSGYVDPLRPDMTTQNLATEYVGVLQEIDEFGFFLDNCAQNTEAAISGAMNDYMRNTGIQEAGRELNKTLGKADSTINCIAGFATLFDSKGILDDAWGLMDMPQLNNRVKGIVRDISDPALLSSVLFNLDEVKDLLAVEQTVCDAIHDGMTSVISKDVAALTGSLNKLAQWSAVAKLATSDPCSLVTNNMLLQHITEPVMDDLIDLYKAATTTQGDVIGTAIDIFTPDGIPGAGVIGDIWDKGSLMPVGTYMGSLAEGFSDQIEGGLGAGADVFDALMQGENSISTGLNDFAGNLDAVDFQTALENVTDISFEGVSLDISEFTDPLGDFASGAFDMAGGAFDYVDGVLSAGGGIIGDALSLAFGGLLGGSGLPVTAPGPADVASAGAAGAGAGGGSAKTREVFGSTGSAVIAGGATIINSISGNTTAFAEASMAVAGSSVSDAVSAPPAYLTTALNDMSGTISALDVIARPDLPAELQFIDTSTQNFDAAANALSQARASSDWSAMTLGSCFGGSGSTASACASSGGLWRSMQGVMNTGQSRFNIPSLNSRLTKRAQTIESVFNDNKLFDVSTLLT
jgi:hypothetical protein